MNTTRLDQFDNSDYAPGPWLTRVLWVLISGLFFQTWFPWPSALKRTLLRLFGAKVGRGVVLKPRVTIKYPWKLTVGDHCWIGEHVWIDNLGQVSIGNHCCLSQGALLLCGNHNYKKPTFDLMVGDIIIEDGVWISAHASNGTWRDLPLAQRAGLGERCDSRSRRMDGLSRSTCTGKGETRTSFGP